MSNIGTYLSLLWVVVLIIWMVVLFHGKFERIFNLTDKRSYIKSDEVWQKFNALATEGDVRISKFDLTDRAHWSFSVSFEPAKGETAGISKDGIDPNELINEAYDWALERGFVKAE